MLDTASNNSSLIGAWTQSEIDALVDMWGRGLSASQIAKALGRVSRNSVIGKISRLREKGIILAARPPTNMPNDMKMVNARIKAEAAAKKSAPVKQKRAALPTLPISTGTSVDVGTWEAIDEAAIVGLLQLTHNTCCWPIDGREDYAFCGRPVARRRYCAEHYRRAHRLKDNVPMTTDIGAQEAVS